MAERIETIDQMRRRLICKALNLTGGVERAYPLLSPKGYPSKRNIYLMVLKYDINKVDGVYQ